VLNEFSFKTIGLDVLSGASRHKISKSSLAQLGGKLVIVYNTFFFKCVAGQINN